MARLKIAIEVEVDAATHGVRLSSQARAAITRAAVDAVRNSSAGYLTTTEAGDPVLVTAIHEATASDDRREQDHQARELLLERVHARMTRAERADPEWDRRVMDWYRVEQEQFQSSAFTAIRPRAREPQGQVAERKRAEQEFDRVVPVSGQTVKDTPVVLKTIIESLTDRVERLEAESGSSIRVVRLGEALSIHIPEKGK